MFPECLPNAWSLHHLNSGCQAPLYLPRAFYHPYGCKYPVGEFRSRDEDVCPKAKVGDTITLKRYTWKKENAYAVILDKVGADLGVLPKHRLPALEKWETLDGLKGAISFIEKKQTEDSDEENISYQYDIEIYLEKRQ